MARGAFLFVVGDYLAGGLTGAAIALAVHGVVPRGFDLALAMVLGVGLGTVTHFILGMLLSPLLGMFHVMVPGSLIGMYGGMLFAMRDAMQPVSLVQALLVGVTFGVVMTALVHAYDRALVGRPQQVAQG